ncbi:MAG: hypothetical protein P1V34_19760, partial [Alphaproteobacteria bacterium]|nr:hypothetical protein [Alphaproteobacteria bacterium]
SLRYSVIMFFSEKSPDTNSINDNPANCLQNLSTIGKKPQDKTTPAITSHLSPFCKCRLIKIKKAPDMVAS